MKVHFRLDLWLLVPVVVLIIVSLTTLLSINISFFKSQLLSLLIAIIAFLFFSTINIEFLKQLKVPIYFIALFLLAIVFFIGIESRGAVRWIDIFGTRLQFSEILKPFLALSLASFLSESEYSNLKYFFLVIFLMLPVVLLIGLQPDLGNGLIYTAVALFTLLVSGFPIAWFGLILLPFLLLSPILWTVLHTYQRQRILTFLKPSVDPQGASYNGIQAIIAVGSGIFLGKGFSETTQSGLRFLPERHTDFIFATLAEGLGFIGASLVIIALLLLCYRIYVIFENSNDLFTKVFAAASFGFLLIQGCVNIGMNLGYLPIVGVTLPFVSYGGSSLLSNFIFLGILSSLSASQRNKEVLEIR